MTPLEIAARLEKFGMWRTVERIAREHRVEPIDVVGRTCRASVVAARHHVWSVIRDTLAMSYPEIGSFFEFDHSTVLEGIRRHHQRGADPLWDKRRTWRQSTGYATTAGPNGPCVRTH